MTAKEQRLRLQGILLGSEPQLLEQEAREGTLAVYGIGAKESDLSVISQLERAMLPRWWTLLYLTGGEAETLCRELAFSEMFLEELQRAQRLFLLPRAADALSLRRKLSRFTDEEEACYLEMTNAYTLADPAFAAEEKELERLLCSGEAYRQDMLAVSEASLSALGLPQARIPFTMTLLLDAVVKAPALNTYETLAKLAVFFWKGK